MRRLSRILLGLICVAISGFGQSGSENAPIIQDGTPVVMSRKPGPRTSSGKPNLSGLWTLPSTDEIAILASRFGADKREAPSLTSWATERFEYNRDRRPTPGFAEVQALPADDPRRRLIGGGSPTFGGRQELNPLYKCVPPGLAYMVNGWAGYSPQEIVQTDKRILMLYEYGPTIRQIWMDGRKHTDPPDLTWMGESIGKWEGDTLVVDTVGLRDEFWLDSAGHVASPSLHIIERYKRIDYYTLQIEYTFDDPKAFTKPWTRRQFRRLRPTWEMIQDNRCYPGSPEVKAQKDIWNEGFVVP